MIHEGRTIKSLEKVAVSYISNATIVHVER